MRVRENETRRNKDHFSLLRSFNFSCSQRSAINLTELPNVFLWQFFIVFHIENLIRSDQINFQTRSCESAKRVSAWKLKARKWNERIEILGETYLGVMKTSLRTILSDRTGWKSKEIEEFKLLNINPKHKADFPCVSSFSYSLGWDFWHCIMLSLIRKILPCM
jgi:hypothetical protein